MKILLPKLDPEIQKLKPQDLPTFSDHVRRSELEHVKAFLESANVGGELGDIDMRPAALMALLDRGRATGMAVLMVLANHYRRAKEWVQRKEKTKPGGALSDMRILGESAYSQVLLTTDREFVACGEIVNEVVPEPRVRPWDLG